MCEPNPKQDALASLPIQNILAIAPAGCGKTEALARRAQVLLARADVVSPHQILALTYSNKARDNLANRMAEVVGRSWRRRVSVTNFHGLAARIVRAHSRAIGLAPGFHLPEEPWRRRTRRELGVTPKSGDAFETALREAKSGPFDDPTVLARLAATGHEQAIRYENRLRAEQRLDHDDLLRHLARLLLIAPVRELYRAHFAAVLVDEVQDLSPLQFDIVRGVGGDSVTYAGDPAQGIYTFAGADPAGVFESIRRLAPTVVEFTKSYRSASNVLNTVNVLARTMGTTELTCGCPERWPDDGHVIYLERPDTDEEASSLLAVLAGVRISAQASIAVVCRRGTRLEQFRNALVAAGVPFQDWSMPTHVPQIVELLRRHVREASTLVERPVGQLAELERLCRNSLDDNDATAVDELASACADLSDLVEGGVTLSDAVARCRGSSLPDKPVGPGLHLLNGHKGKGQEFDWVVVLGLEEGQIPDFRNPDDPEELRVLHVMVSRAKYGLVLTYARSGKTSYGRRATQASRWLHALRQTATASDVQ